MSGEDPIIAGMAGRYATALFELAVEARKLKEVEGDLKSFRAPVKLYSQLALLAGDVGNGSADFPPTTQQVEVHEVLKKELAEALSKFKDLINKDVVAFNKLLEENNIPGIVTTIK